MQSLEVSMRTVAAMTRTLWNNFQNSGGAATSGGQRAVTPVWTRAQQETFALLDDIMSTNPKPIPKDEMPSANSASGERNPQAQHLHLVVDRIKGQYYTYIPGLGDIKDPKTTWQKIGAVVRARMLREMWVGAGIPPSQAWTVVSDWFNNRRGFWKDKKQELAEFVASLPPFVSYLFSKCTYVYFKYTLVYF